MKRPACRKAHIKKIIIANLIAITTVGLATLGICYGMLVYGKEARAAGRAGEPLTANREHLVCDYNGVIHNEYLTGVFSPDCVFQFIFYNGFDSENMIVTSKEWAKNALPDGTKRICQRIPEHIVSAGYDRITAVPLAGDARSLLDVQTVRGEDVPAADACNLIDWEIRAIDINIKDKHFQKIVDKREEAIQRGILLSGDEDVVPAKLRVEGRKYAAELRLKGDWTDHLAGDQWSYRIELKGDNCIYGMQKFSVQAPETRNGIWEAVLYRAYQEANGATLRYDFVDVFVNGEYKGVYALEEFPEKRVIEHSRFREGPILKLDEDFLWEHRAFYSADPQYLRFLHVVQPFSEKKTVQNAQLAAYARYAITGYTKVRAGEVPPEQVFDIEKYAKLNAIRSVFAAEHALAEHNQRHYYNPITGLLEPLPFDEEPMLTADRIYYAEYYPYLIEDPDYLEQYRAYVDAFCDGFAAFYARNSADFNKMKVMLERMNPVDDGLETLTKRIRSLRGALERYDDVQISRAMYSHESGKYVVCIRNPNGYPVWVCDAGFLAGDGADAVDVVPQRRAIEGNSEWLVPIPDALSMELSDITLSLTVTGAFISDRSYTKVVNNAVSMRISAIGHAYGDHNYGDGMDAAVLAYLEQASMDADMPMSYCFFTGDIVDGTVPEDYADFGALQSSLPFPCYCVRGNHDKNYPALCDQYFGDAYGSFYQEGSLFFWLDADIENDWDISTAQQNMIREALREHPDAENVFVFTHEAVWWEHDNPERFGKWSPNSGTTCGYNVDSKPNFYTDVLPLFSAYKGRLYLVSGDAGCITAREYFFRQEGSVCYIACGTGDGNRDCVVEFYVMDDHSVVTKLIGLDSDQAGMLGEYYDYTY